MLDYDQAIHLDAEALAEGGIAAAYEELRPHLARHLPDPLPIVELCDDDAPSYAVQCAGTAYVIHAPDVPDSAEQSWGRATFALFDLVNRQLAGTKVRLYAINGGNDLFGILLTPEAALAARASLTGPTDWPYLPELRAPWFGQAH